jgi:hypothetical protein
MLIIEIFVLSLFYQSNGAAIKKTTMNKLTKKQKAFLLSRVVEYMVSAGKSIEGYFFMPSSKFNFTIILLHIQLLEENLGMQKEETFLYLYPEYNFLLK